MYIELAVLALFVFCYSIIAGRLERAATSGPIVFVVAGLLMGPMGLGWFDGDVTRTELRMFADLTLALILFIDAANADLAILRRHFQIPTRMLLFGLPGVILLGTLTATVLFDVLSLYEAAILGTRLIVVQETIPAGCVDGTRFDGQFVECDLTTSTLLGMFCKRRLGDAVNDPNAGEQYILTRL